MSFSSDAQAATARAEALGAEFKSWIDQIGQSPELEKAKEKMDEAVAWLRTHVHGEEPSVDEDPNSDREQPEINSDSTA